MSDLTTRELAEITAANDSGKQPVVFIHGLWLLASSWGAWRERFEAEGYATVAPSWPTDPETIAEARSNPQAMAGVSVAEITTHLADIIGRLDRKPIVIGHSFGGLFTQKLAGLGLSAASVAIDPGPFRGVLPLPLSTLKSSGPVLTKPGNAKKAVTLTPEQFRYAFANTVSAEESAELYERFHVAGAGRVLFQAALANINPRTEVTVDSTNPERGPLLVISGEHDHTVPYALAHAAFRRQQRNPGVTEFVEVPGRGHSLTIDSGWQDVAELALSFAAAHVAKV